METNKNLFFIGFMGCGKSTMARLLTEETGMELIEMDETIEKREKMTISDIFATKGEPYFREKIRFPKPLQQNRIWDFLLVV